MKRLILSIIAAILLSLIGQPIHAEDYSCLQSPDTVGTDPDWKTSGERDLKFVVSWAFKDPENCIVGIDPSWDYKFKFPKSVGGGDYYEFPASWKVSREGEMALVSAETEFPVALLQALNHIDNSDSDYFFSQLGTGKYAISAQLRVKKAGGYTTQLIRGNYGFPQVWGHWFSKNQGIYPNQCNPKDLAGEIKTNWKVIETGVKPRIEITLSQENNCIFLVHSGPLESYKVKSFVNPVWLTQAEYPYWDGPGTVYFKSILLKPNEIIQVGLGNFIDNSTGWDSNSVSNSGVVKVAKIPTQVLSHDDYIQQNNNVIKISSLIDGSKLDSTSSDVVTVFLGIYSWRYDSPTYTPSGWNITFSGNSWTARYNKGGSSPPGTRMSYKNIAIKIPITNLLLSAEVKAAAELKAKQEAEAKAAAELKAKQEAEAKAAAELKAKQEAEAKAAAPELSRLAQQKQYCLQHNIDAQILRQRMTTLDKDPNLLKTKELDISCDVYGVSNFWSDASNFAKTRAIWESYYSADLKTISKFEEEAAAKAAASKKTTITCVKGKLTKKVTAIKPVCPSGYKKKV